MQNEGSEHISLPSFCVACISIFCRKIGYNIGTTYKTETLNNMYGQPP